jgi:hypothetical protein
MPGHRGRYGFLERIHAAAVPPYDELKTSANHFVVGITTT